MLPDYAPQLSPICLLNNAILILLFLSAAVTDLKWNRIYNLQTYPAMACGLVLGFAAAGVHGALLSFLGLIVGLSLLFVFYMFGGVGAGDVKLLGAIGALKGASFVLWTMFYTGLVGGGNGTGHHHLARDRSADAKKSCLLYLPSHSCSKRARRPEPPMSSLWPCYIHRMLLRPLYRIGPRRYVIEGRVEKKRGGPGNG